MTDEELDRLIHEVEGQVSQLPDENQRLNWAERKQRALVLGRAQSLNRIKEARNEGNIRQETRAIVEYSILMKYGKNFLLYNIMRARMGSGMWW